MWESLQRLGLPIRDLARKLNRRYAGTTTHGGPAITSPAIFLVVPAYNPGRGVIEIVRKALPHVAQVVIVDDGCDKAEKAYLQQCLTNARVTLLAHESNKGKGVALHAGVSHCLAGMNEGDFILTMDSDGQHDPDDIPKFRRLLDGNKEVHFALGERISSPKTPIKSKIGNGLARWLFRVQFGGNVQDTQTGFRLLSVAFAKSFAARVKPGRYETEMDMLILASHTLPAIHSVKVRTIYLDNNKNTKYRAIADSYNISKLFIKYGAVSIASFCIDYLAFIALTYVLEIPYLASNALARFVSTVFNFSGHRLYSFKSQARLTMQAARYALAVATALALATALLYLCVDGLGAPKYLAKPAVDAAVFVMNFLVLSRLVFSERRSRQKLRPHSA